MKYRTLYTGHALLCALVAFLSCRFGLYILLGVFVPRYMYAPAERSSALPPLLDESGPVFCCASGPVEKPHLLNGVKSFPDRNLFL